MLAQNKVSNVLSGESEVIVLKQRYENKQRALKRLKRRLKWLWQINLQLVKLVLASIRRSELVREVGPNQRALSRSQWERISLERYY